MIVPLHCFISSGDNISWVDFVSHSWVTSNPSPVWDIPAGTHKGLCTWGDTAAPIGQTSSVWGNLFPVCQQAPFVLWCCDTSSLSIDTSFFFSILSTFFLIHLRYIFKIWPRYIGLCGQRKKTYIFIQYKLNNHENKQKNIKLEACDQKGDELPFIYPHSGKQKAKIPTK